MEAGFPFLAFAEAEVFHEFGWGVAEPDGDGLAHSLFGEVDGGVPSVGGGAGFFGEGESGGGVSKDESRLGHTNSLNGLGTSGGET